MRILLFADVHFSVNSEPEDERWFPPQVARMSSQRAKEFLSRWDEKVAEAYKRFLARAREFGPYDLIVSLGDNTPGDNERGMLTEKARKQWDMFRQKLEESFLSVGKKFVWGDHDVGYLYKPSRGFPRIGLEKDLGMTKGSFEIAQKMLGPPWQMLHLGGFTFLLLNSSIIRTSRESPNLEIRDFFSKLVEEQNQFICQNLERTDKAILAIHDVRQLQYLRNVLAPYLQGQKIVLTLGGHFHLRLLGKIYAMKPFLRRLNLKIVPSSLGSMVLYGVLGKGGFCILELPDQNKHKLNYHWL